MGAAQAAELPRVCAGRDLKDTAWQGREQWQAVNAVIDYQLERLGEGSLAAIRKPAESLKSAYQAIYPMLEHLCEMTCPWCEAPCCRLADPRFDLRDLLFIHLVGAPVPMGQPRGEGHASCRYLGPRGCRLPRRSRPWICTWYLCPRQKQCLASNDLRELEEIEHAARKIKEERINTESGFIASLTELGR